MKIHLQVFYIVSVILFSFSFSFFGIGTKEAHADSAVTLTIKYANDTSKSNILSVNSGEKYVLSEEYSWVRDQTSRHNLQAYSIDHGPFVSIPRVARGNFTLDVPTESNHEIVFLSVVQYPIEIVGTDSVIFEPPSPTNDNWFDINSNEKIIVPYVIQSDEKTRTQLKEWSYDGETTMQIQKLESGNFNTQQIHMSNSHSVDFVYVTQYYLNLVSEYGHIIGAGWYDSGTTATIDSSFDYGFPIRHVFSGWSGPALEPNKQTTTVLMKGPTTVTANWTLDYTPTLLLMALIIAAGFIILYLKRRVSPSKKIVLAEPKKSEREEVQSTAVAITSDIPNRTSDDAYSKEIESYILQKSMEGFELFENSGVLSKEKKAKLKEKIAEDSSGW